MLFTFKNCRCCKKEMTDIKVLLNNIFPAGICDEICDYNLYCSKCKDLYDKERTYKDFTSLCLTTTEKQIHFFQTRMEKSPIFLSNTNRTNTRVMKREIDELMDRSDCKIELLNNRLFFQAIKSYVKKNWKYTYHILKQFHHLNYITFSKKNNCWWFPNVNGTYVFRNKAYNVKDILEIFLREYTEELFRGYENYLNQEEIKEHLQKVINT